MAASNFSIMAGAWAQSSTARSSMAAASALLVNRLCNEHFRMNVRLFFQWRLWPGGQFLQLECLVSAYVVDAAPLLLAQPSGKNTA